MQTKDQDRDAFERWAVEQWGRLEGVPHNAWLGFAAGAASEREQRAKLQTVASQVLRDMQAQGVLIEWQTVLAEALGERECEHCGNAFTGEAGRSICGDCLTAYSEAMRQDEQRAEWHAEMRRDAFGA